MIRLSEPTELDVGHAIKRLCAIHRRPYKADMDTMVPEWHDGLKCFSREVLEAAVNRARDDDDFPTLPRLRKHCFAIERERKPVSATEPGVDPVLQCPTCSERLTWHDVVVAKTDDDVPFSTAKEFIDHRDGCPYRAGVERLFKLYGYRWREDGEQVEHLSDRNARKDRERLERRRHKDNPAAKALPTVAAVVKTLPAPSRPRHPEVEPMRAKIPATTQRLWEEIPPPPEPAEAILTHR